MKIATTRLMPLHSGKGRTVAEALKCVGFGAKTKWYFTLNALIREFAGYLRLTWKRHIFVAAAIILIVTIAI